MQLGIEQAIRLERGERERASVSVIASQLKSSRRRSRDVERVSARQISTSPCSSYSVEITVDTPEKSRASSLAEPRTPRLASLNFESARPTSAHFNHHATTSNTFEPRRPHLKPSRRPSSPKGAAARDTERSRDELEPNMRKLDDSQP